MQSLVTKSAPHFEATAVVDGNKIIENFSLSQYQGEKYVVLFFYPKDFTFVCPTELHAFQAFLPEFEKRNVQVVGCSTDTEFSHRAWLKTPKKEGGIEGVTYPIVADTNKTIADHYGVLTGEYDYNEEGKLIATEEIIAFRGLFLIDKDGIIQHQLINNLPLGRSVEEVLRMVDALQHFEAHGEVCPANWSKGKKAMKAYAEGVVKYFQDA